MKAIKISPDEIAKLERLVGQEVDIKVVVYADQTTFGMEMVERDDWEQYGGRPGFTRDTEYNRQGTLLSVLGYTSGDNTFLTHIRLAECEEEKMYPTSPRTEYLLSISGSDGEDWFASWGSFNAIPQVPDYEDISSIFGGENND